MRICTDVYVHCSSNTRPLQISSISNELESPRIVVITPGTRLMSVESRDRHILDRGNGLKWLVSKTVPVFV